MQPGGRTAVIFNERPRAVRLGGQSRFGRHESSIITARHVEEGRVQQPSEYSVHRCRCRSCGNWDKSLKMDQRSQSASEATMVRRAHHKEENRGVMWWSFGGGARHESYLG